MSGSLITLPVRLGVRCAGLAMRGTYAVTERAWGLVGAVAGSIIGPDSPEVDLDGAQHDGAEWGSTRGSSASARSASPPVAPPPPQPRPPVDPPPVPEPRQPPEAADLPPAPEPRRPPEGADPPPAPQPPRPPEAADPPPAPEPSRPPEAADAAPPGAAGALSAPLLDGPAHVSAEPELVEQVAEPGAEDGAGAEVRIAEPWDGYDHLKADDVIDRITGASVAELAAVELYELSGRSRQTVLDAVKRELSRSEPAG